MRRNKYKKVRPSLKSVALHSGGLISPQEKHRLAANGLGLDAWELARSGKHGVWYKLLFFIDGTGFFLLDHFEHAIAMGYLQVYIPELTAKEQFGFVRVLHLQPFKRPDQTLLIFGELLIDGTLHWRFLCPQTKHLTQVLYLNQTHSGFSSRMAIKRRVRGKTKAGLDEVLYHVGHWAEAEDKLYHFCQKDGELNAREQLEVEIIAEQLAVHRLRAEFARDYI